MLDPGGRRLPAAANVGDLVESPDVAITPHGMRVDGSESDLSSVFLQLKHKRELWMELNPGRTFPGVVTFRIDGVVPAGIVKTAVQRAARAGYPNIAFQVRRLQAGQPR